ncbi:MAG: hypothetical protein HRU09_19065 [Oligoflexales bacterium]|nr:hypothetical protein [Oligoflexales bacterium]
MSDKFSEVNQILFRAMRSASLEVFQVEAKSPDYSILEFKEKDTDKLIYTQDIACIMLIGEEIKIVYKIHYWLDDAIEVLRKVHPSHSETIVEKKSRDYMKELSNVTAGRMKYKLLTTNCNIGQSLPVNFDGFNQLFFSEKRNNEFSDSWAISNKQQEFIMSFSIQYYKDSILSKINESMLDDSPPPDVELF